MNQRIGILCMGEKADDPRVLRQARYLSGRYEVAVFGPGDPAPELAESKVRFVRLSPERPGEDGGGVLSGLRNGALLLGRANPALYEGWFWQNPLHRRAAESLAKNPCDLILANGWQALAVASEAAAKTGARVVADLPGYAPRESESLSFQALQAPAVRYFIKKNAAGLAGSVTVSPGLAEMYEKRFGLSPVIVRNAPEYEATPDHAVDGNRIHLIHHGTAHQARALADLIEIIGLCDRRFFLHYMLVGDQDNIQALTRLARKKVPNRVFFHETVKPKDVLSRIWRYDMSLIFQRPAGLNDLYCLPKKFFESIAAGLAVVAGPGPEMQDLIRRYRLGCVSAGFSVKKVAEMLNALSAKDIEIMRAGAREAAKKLCAEKEHEALLALCARALAGETAKSAAPEEAPDGEAPAGALEEPAADPEA
ncbi:MAG: hypothetical protein AB1921_16325 [Thermodesulfobacteriota bacterium]